MPKLNFTPEELRGYFKENWRHSFYKQTCEHAEAMQVHSDGTFPKKLIEERRPNEPEVVQKYRKDIFVPKTKPVFGKVLASLSKIRRSSDWTIKYKDDDELTRVLEGESLEDYCPYFDSVTNWAFSVMLKRLEDDPNAVLAIMPLESPAEVAENAYVRPFPYIFDSCHVIDFKADDFAVLVNPVGSTYWVKGKPYKGKSFFTITTVRVTRYDQVDGRGTLAIAPGWDFDHGFAELPAWRLGGVVSGMENNDFIYESRLAGMLPDLDEAVREYSDLQASKVIHIYPERWEYSQNECPTCKGTTKRQNPLWRPESDSDVPPRVDCDNPNCQQGYVVAGPYSKIMVRPLTAVENAGTNASIPTPPAGYVEKDVEIVRIQDEGVKQHMYDALAAINFQFLEQTPLVESGKAKEVDKDELNNTVHSIAEDVVRNIDLVYRYTAFYRYMVQYTPEEIEEKMLPLIPVPEKYDMLSSAHLAEELTLARENKLNPILMNAMEIEYSAKKFNTNHEVRDLLSLVLTLDPLPNVSEEEKTLRLTNKGIRLETYIVSSNIHEFVQRAMDENEDFAAMELAEQKEIIADYAQAIIEEQKEEQEKLAEEMTSMGLSPEGKPLPGTNMPPGGQKGPKTGFGGQSKQNSKPGASGGQK
jgi:hypothetical protein